MATTTIRIDTEDSAHVQAPEDEAQASREKTITTAAGGKKNPAQGLPGGSRVRPQGTGEQAVNKSEDEPTEPVEKGWPEHGGVHYHALVRERSRTEEDGKHRHVFQLPDGTLVFTTEDGSHMHSLPSDIADETGDASSAHYHMVTMPDGTRLRTRMGGQHDHEALVSSTACDGQHEHELELPDGTVVRSLTGGKWWEMEGKPPQQHKAVAAWVLFQDPPYRRGALGSTQFRVRSMAETIKRDDGDDEQSYRRTVVFERRAKRVEGFPELCGVCKLAPATSDLWSTSWEESVSACDDCANHFVPKELAEVPDGEDVDAWLGWPLLLDLAKRDDTPEGDQNFRCDVEIAKRDDERMEVTGVVLEPDEVDAQNDTVTAPIIERAAKDFLSRFGQPAGSRLGLMHKQFGDVGLELRESYIAPTDMKIGGKKVKKGSWIMTLKVVSKALWKAIKEGRLTGFSIGGVAAVKEPKPAI